MKKWIWITVPAVAVGLGLVFLGGGVFAQNQASNTAPSVNWMAMADYCRSIFTGDTAVAGDDFTEMHVLCQNATGSGNFSPGDMMGNGGMMGGYSGNATYGLDEMMGNHSTGRGMMGW